MNNTNDNTRQLISEMKEMLNMRKGKKLTLEGLVYGEDGEEMMNGQMGQVPPDDGMPADAQAQPQPQAQPQGQPQGQQMNPEQQANPLDEDPEVAKLITNIRVSTLEGLRKLAQNPESAQYELLKKIFLLVDKAVEDKVNPEK
jgi:hypothetical protein